MCPPRRLGDCCSASQLPKPFGGSSASELQQVLNGAPHQMVSEHLLGR